MKERPLIKCEKHGIQRAGYCGISQRPKDGHAKDFCFACFCEWIEENFGKPKTD